MVNLSADFYSELSDLELYYLEIFFTEEKNKNYELFNYLVSRGYQTEASELWDNVIINNRFVKPS